MTYKIFEGLLPEVEKKLKRVARKCAKHGNDFVYEIIDEVMESVELNGNNVKLKFYIINVEGTAKIEDWECVATLEHYKDGNVIRRINTDIDIPEKFRFSDDVCEHCNSKRKRNQLYIIHNVKTDEWKQVGKNCLALYTRGLNAEYVIAYLEGITELEENGGIYIGWRDKANFDVREILAYATELIDKMGYRNANSDFPTKFFVSNLMYDTVEGAIRFFNKVQNDVHFSRSDFLKPSTCDKVEEIIKYWESLEPTTEFIHNVQTLIKSGFTTGKNFGILAYLPEGYNKHILKEESKRKEKAEENSGHYGEVGKRYKDMKVRYIRTLCAFENMFGISFLSKIVLDDGTVLFWTGKGIDYGCDGEPKTPDTISFTIKEHGYYRGEAQTKVTRCMIKYKEKEVA